MSNYPKVWKRMNNPAMEKMTYRVHGSVMGDVNHCATNMVPERSKQANVLNQKDLKKVKELHKRLMEDPQPEMENL